MTCDNNEIWLTYHQVSRANRPVSSQLLDLDFQGHKLRDLEDVLDHVFQQGWVDAKYRTCAYWEKKNGERVGGSCKVEDLIQQGVGKCQDSALRLVIADVPTTLWFSYVYTHNPSAPVVVQRVKTTEFTCEKLAHITNYLFNKGFLPNHLRCYVHWQRACGQAINEDAKVVELLESGHGLCEDRPIRLVIDQPVCGTTPTHTPPVPHAQPEHHFCRCHCHCQVPPVHHCRPGPVFPYSHYKNCHCA